MFPHTLIHSQVHKRGAYFWGRGSGSSWQVEILRFPLRHVGFPYITFCTRLSKANGALH